MKKLLALSVLLLLSLAGCHRLGPEVAGSGKRETQRREIGPFTSIATEGAFSVEVVCGKDLSLEVEGDDNVLPFVTSEVGNNVLRLRNTRNYSTNEPVKFRISVPNIEALSVNGAGNIQISGMSNDKFEIDANGAPTISVSGTTKVLDVEANGAAKVDTHNLRSSQTVVDSKGVSTIDLGVSDQLDVTVAGPSHVTYRGDPSVKKTIHGPGKVEKKRDEGA